MTMSWNDETPAQEMVITAESQDLLDYVSNQYRASSIKISIKIYEWWISYLVWYSTYILYNNMELKNIPQCTELANQGKTE